MPESEIEHTEAANSRAPNRNISPPTVNRAARNTYHAEHNPPKKGVDRMWHHIGKDPGIQRVGSVPLNIPSKEVEEEAETKEETKSVLGEYFIATHANLICSAFLRTRDARMACALTHVSDPPTEPGIQSHICVCPI